MPSPWAVGDAITGNILFAGVLGAILYRERTGKGEFVTTSLFGSSIWVNCVMAIFSQPKYNYVFPKDRKGAAPNGTCYRCADDEWIQYGFEDYDRFMPQLMEALGVPDLIRDPRFDTRSHANENSLALMKIFEKQFLLKTSNEWLEIFKKIGMVCCILKHMRDVASDPQAWANGYLENFVFRNNSSCAMPCPPVRFGSTGAIRSKLAPVLGADTQEVLAGLSCK